MQEPFYEETWFYVPEREPWMRMIDDEEPDLESAENVLDDILLFEVGSKRCLEEPFRERISDA